MFIRNSHARLEYKLNLLISEVRAGRREGSVISTISLDSASRNETETWADLRRELEDIGISSSIINDNKQFIVAWFQNAIDCGELKEETSYEDMGSETRLLHRCSSNNNHDQIDSKTNRGTSPEYASLGPILSQSASPAQSVAPEQILVAGIGHSSTRHEHMKCSVQTSWHQPKIKGSGISSLLSILRSKDTLLFEAIESQNPDKVASLLTKGASVNANIWGERPLHRAVKVGHIGILKALCDQGADVNARTEYRGTPLRQMPLHCISEQSPGEGIRLLLQMGADIEAVDIPGTTPLHRASRCGNLSCVQSLLESGAKVGAKSAMGWTALHESVYRDSKPKAFKLDPQCTRLLLEHGAEVDARNNEGMTAWQLAMREKRRNKISLELLKEYGAKTTRESSG